MACSKKCVTWQCHCSRSCVLHPSRQSCQMNFFPDSSLMQATKGLKCKPMKAIVYTHYGSLDVLQFKETEKPLPNAAELLLNIYAASANPLDWHLMREPQCLARLDAAER